MGSFGTFLWVYAYNLRTPIVAFCALGILLCLVIGIWSLGVKGKTTFATPENGDARWRTHTSTQGGIILAVIAAMFWAIPSPDYDVRIVYKAKIVERRVPVKVFSGTRVIQQPSTYQSVHDRCVSSYDYDVNSDILAICHQQAMDALAAIRVSPQVVVKRFIEHDKYADLFKSCNDYNLDQVFDKDPVAGARLRNERLAICHKAALQASTPRQYLH